MDKIKNFKWWLGLILALLTALATYLSSCTTSTSLSITADEISNPNINFTDSTKFINPLKR